MADHSPEEPSFRPLKVGLMEIDPDSITPELLGG